MKPPVPSSPVVPTLSDAAHPAEAQRERAASAPTVLTLTVMDPRAAEGHRDAWVDLLGRCLEDNVFLDPDFALAVASSCPPSRRPRFAMVWGPDAAGGRVLVALCPVSAPHARLRGLATTWTHDFATLGIPLLDRDLAPQALDVLLDGLLRELPGCAALLLASVPAEGPTAALLRDAARRSGRGLAVLAQWRRAVLRREDRQGHALPPKRTREWRRQRRKLGEMGDVRFVSLRSGPEFEAAVEQFLTLEARGWKGKTGTALLNRPAQAAFARSMMIRLQRRGACAISRLTLDGAAIAMAVVLSCGRTDYLWKIAYAEDLARFSPGVQLVLDLSRAEVGSARTTSTDSCAVPGHAMIERLWPDRLSLQDLALALAPGRPATFGFAVARERLWRRARAAVKALVHRWRRARDSADPGRAGSRPRTA